MRISDWSSDVCSSDLIARPSDGSGVRNRTEPPCCGAGRLVDRGGTTEGNHTRTRSPRLKPDPSVSAHPPRHGCYLRRPYAGGVRVARGEPAALSLRRRRQVFAETEGGSDAMHPTGTRKRVGWGERAPVRVKCGG